MFSCCVSCCIQLSCCVTWEKSYTTLVTGVGPYTSNKISYGTVVNLKTQRGGSLIRKLFCYHAPDVLAHSRSFGTLQVIWHTTMTTQLDLSLPEIAIEDFKWAWIWFELVTKVNDGKRTVILPLLLHGKLADDYWWWRPTAFVERTDVSGWTVVRPLTADQSFMSHHQGPGKSVRDLMSDPNSDLWSHTQLNK